jgi:short-subunit dehydrogenase
MHTPQTIVITGASSGLGAALAQAYAHSGITLGLLGRNKERLQHVEQDCIALGATVESVSLDVRDTEAMRTWLIEFNAKYPIDLLIANAGISAGLGEEGESEEQVREVFSVNIDGVLASILPVIPLMQKRGSGQIAIMSSLAGIRGIPSCPAYSASKNAVRAYGEGLRGSLKKHGINVSVICPGYIRTPMTDVNTFPMPFIMDADKAAHIIKGGLQKNSSRIAFPLALYFPLWLLSCLSLWLTDPLFAALPKKTTTHRHPAAKPQDDAFKAKEKQ